MIWFSLRTQLDLLFRQQALMAGQIAEIQRIISRELPMAKEAFKTLTEAVEHAATVKQAAIVLIKDMGDRLEALAQHPTPGEILALAASVREHADELATKIAAHEDDGGDGDDKEE